VVDKATQQAVRDRAGRRCEYCYFPESLAEFRLSGLTDAGRATVQLLQINRADPVAVRQLLMEAGIFAVVRYP
jgi:hypothetical protein